MKKFVIGCLSLYLSAVYAGDNSVDNVLNNNAGSVGNVTINQSSAVTNERVASEKKINELLGNAAKVLQSGSPPEKAAEANQIVTFSGMANEVNRLQATTTQKNEICKSKAKAIAEIMGYQVGFLFGKCAEVF